VYIYIPTHMHIYMHEYICRYMSTKNNIYIWGHTTWPVSLLIHLVMPPVAAVTAPCALSNAICADALAPMI